MEWFNRKVKIERVEVPVPVIVEVPKPVTRLEDTEELRTAVLSLQHHPGFQHLLQKLKLQRHLLETRLKEDRHDNLKNVEFLQSGLHWVGWLEAQLNKEVKLSERTGEFQPNPTESENIEVAHKEIMRNYEVVGG